ncbi:hypothetical protein [Streptomyces sp. NPDC051561]|uniref:hypothetical protein n=1 Tax=Streptomyces sp. NPDC051561 TaxID=3365658 RepID=UPI0037BAD9DE
MRAPPARLGARTSAGHRRARTTAVSDALYAVVGRIECASAVAGGACIVCSIPTASSWRRTSATSPGVLGEADDGLGDARRESQAVAVTQILQEQSPERVCQEGARARRPVAVLVHGGERDDDACGNLQEHPVQARTVDVLGDRAGGVDVVGLHRPDVGKRVGDVLRFHRGERRGDGVLGRDSSLGYGPPR